MSTGQVDFYPPSRLNEIREITKELDRHGDALDFFDLNPDLCILVKNGIICHANNAALRFGGELSGKKVSDLVPAYERCGFKPTERILLNFKDKNKETVMVDCSVAVTEDTTYISGRIVPKQCTTCSLRAVKHER